MRQANTKPKPEKAPEPLYDQVRHGVLEASQQGTAKIIPFEASYTARARRARKKFDDGLRAAFRRCGMEVGRRLPNGGKVYYNKVIQHKSYFQRVAEWHIYSKEEMKPELRNDIEESIYIELGPGDGKKSAYIMSNTNAAYYLGVDFVKANTGPKVKKRIETIGKMQGRTKLVQDNFLDPELWNTRLPELIEKIRTAQKKPGAKVVIAMNGSTFGNFTPQQQLALLKHMSALIGDEGAIHLGYDSTQYERTLQKAYAGDESCRVFFFMGLVNACKTILKIGHPRYEDFKHGLKFLVERTNLLTGQVERIPDAHEYPGAKEDRKRLLAKTKGKTWFQTKRVSIGMTSLRDQTYRSKHGTLTFKEGEWIEMANTSKTSPDEIEKLCRLAGAEITTHCPTERFGKNRFKEATFPHRVKYQVSRIQNIHKESKVKRVLDFVLKPRRSNSKQAMQQRQAANSATPPSLAA